MTVDYKVYDLGDLRLQRGATLRDCKLAYKTFGTLNADKSNVIVYPTWYSGQHYDNEWLVGDGMALDPSKYFIIIPNMLGNGLSSSPSNTPEPYNKSRFPLVTAYDNVRAQHKLVTEHLGIKHIRLVLGWSMGALQTFHWGAMYPDMMDLLAAFLRLVQVLAAQFRLPRGRQGGADRRRRLHGRLVRREAQQGSARRRASLCRLGFLADLLPAET